jgi:hypothetical protein
MPALFAFLLLFYGVERAGAQAAGPGAAALTPHASADTRGLVPARLPSADRIILLRLADDPGGARVTVASDAPLDDYTSRFDGDSYHILIPHSQAAGPRSTLSGSGFTSARFEQRAGDVLLSFRMQAGASMRISKGFNRLELNFKTAPQAQQPGAGASAALTGKPPAVDANGGASSAAPNDEREVFSQMRSQIADLEARIRDLETRQAQGGDQAQGGVQTQQAARAAPESMPVTAAAVEADTADAHQSGTHAGGGDEHEGASSGTPKLQIQGFADINFRASNQRGSTNSFSLGQLDLFLTSRLSEKFSVLGELIVEADQDNKFSLEIHRLLLRYAPNDYLHLSAGRYHSAIGFYNTAYHHGSWFQTAVNRPFIFAFESKGGILPLHNVGISATGRIPSAPFGLRYIAEVGNGRASRSRLDQAVQTARDENNGKSINVGVFARPKSYPGFQTGFSVYRDTLTPAGVPKVGQTIMAGHVVYESRKYEVLNEAVVVRQERNERSFYTPGFYTQFSRRFGNARPYFRYQYVNVPADDPIFPDVGRRNGPSLGIRYDVSDFAAFKAQYDHTQRRRLSSLDELLLQFAFTF